MKKISILKSGLIIFGGLLLSLAIMQCTKVGINAEKLDRAFVGTADSTVFASFYDSTKIAVADVVPSLNDIIVTKGVQSTIKEYCGISTCHGGPINPKLSTYAEIKSLVTPGNPEASKLWGLLTTNDLNKTMPPVSATHELSLTDKTIIYNWIKNGAKEYPDLGDFRPAAIKIITTGCTAANCHNVATSAGSWARAGLLTLAPPPAPGQPSPDTTMFTHIKPNGNSYYCQLSNSAKLIQVWNDYKDSVKKFYSDTVGKASFRLYKTFSPPVVTSSVRGSLSSYDDILMDIMFPKSARSYSTQVPANSGIYPPYYTDPVTLKKYWVQGNQYNVTSSLVSRIDSTLNLANPYTGVFALPKSGDGDMAYSDGGLKPSEIATIKAWYFADPNIPDVWKYGNNNTGIFKYKKLPTNTIIIKH